MSPATEAILVKVDLALRQYDDELVDIERRRVAQMAARKAQASSPVVNNLVSHFPPDVPPPREPTTPDPGEPEARRGPGWLDRVRARWGWI